MSFFFYFLLIKLFYSIFRIIFWLGDLNYRISDVDIVEVKKLIENKMYNKLIQFDQVSWAIKTNFFFIFKKFLFLCTFFYTFYLKKKLRH